MPPDRPSPSAVATLLATWIGVIGLAVLARGAFELNPIYPVKVAAAFGTVVLLTLGTVGRHHPFAGFGPANQITTVRAAIVAMVVGLIGERGMPAIAVSVVGLSVAAAALDGVDGWIARRLRIASRFGARFDVETDAALIQVLAILVWQNGKAGPWILTAGLLRYLFVAAGWFLPWMRGPLPSSLRGRAICVVQTGTLIAAIAPTILPPISGGIAALGLLALGYSFAVDIRWLWLYSLRRTP